MFSFFDDQYFVLFTLIHNGGFFSKHQLMGNVFDVSKPFRMPMMNLFKLNFLKRSLSRGLIVNSRETLNKRFKTEVIISSSHCPFANLAFENYIYENRTLSDSERILFIWRNLNAVIIGRHQNPWKEVNLEKLGQMNIDLCRRMSGGGSVFHDLGNVNFTFFTSKANYNRKENLDYIIETLLRDFRIDVSRNEKDDIVLDKMYKVSGTAAKLGLKNCYHHCTLLCETKLKNLSGLLVNPFGEKIVTNATASIRSKTKNLFSDNFNFDKIVNTFTSNFHRKYRSENETNQDTSIVCPETITTIAKKSKELRSWDWVYGKSPKFTLPFCLLVEGTNFEIKAVINKGKFEDFSFSPKVDSKISDILERLKGCRFHREDILFNLLEFSKDKDKYPICKEIMSLVDAY